MKSHALPNEFCYFPGSFYTHCHFLLQFPEPSEFLFLILIMPHVHLMNLKYLSYIIKYLLSLSYENVTKPGYCCIGPTDLVRVIE